MPFALNNTEDFLIGQERELIPQIQNILTEQRRNATSRLYNSFNYVIEDKKDNEGFIIYLDYAEHGNFVLDGTRKYVSSKPSAKAIQSIMEWIGVKGISIGSGRISSLSKLTKTDPEKQRKAFAFAIWYAQKKRGATWAGSTNFLKPWNNLYKSSDFQEGLALAVAKDLGHQIDVQFQDLEINIKM